MSISRRTRLVGLGAGTLLVGFVPLLTASVSYAVPLPEQCSTTTYAGFGAPMPAPLTINGNASVVATGDGTVLRVTPAALSQAGSAFTTSKVNLVNDGSFSTKFAFRFSNQVNGGADGIVFTVQNLDNNVGGIGGGIGYQGINQSMGVEFDNWNNGAIDGFSDNHAGIDLNGSVNSVARASLFPINLDNPVAVHRAWVDYNGATDTLEVRVADSDVRPAAALLTHTVDLPAVLGGGGHPCQRRVHRIHLGHRRRGRQPRHPVVGVQHCYRPVGTDSAPFVDAEARTPVRTTRRWTSPVPPRTI